jgi:chaperonin GroES
MKYKPGPGYVLIEPFEKEEKSAGGIYLAETSKEKPAKGSVVRVGDPSWKDGIWLDCPALERNVVFYKEWTESEVTIEGKKYIVIKFEDILLIAE